MANSQKIIGGKPIEDAEFHVSLLTKDPETNLIESFCGGILYQKRWIITAAHCVASNVDQDIFASVGVTKRLDFKDQLVPIKAVFIHPEYNPKILRNDLALLYLGDQYSKDLKIPVTLEAPDNWHWNTLTAIGFGNTSSFGVLLGDHLEQVNLQQIPINLCEKSHPFYSQIGLVEKQICSLSVMGRGKDTCQGDSGGPLIINTKDAIHLMGVTSFGFKCAQSGIPGVSTFIPHYKNWIRKVISDFEKEDIDYSLNFCFNKLSPVVFEDEEFSDNSISFYERRVSTIKGLPTVSPNLFESERQVSNCEYKHLNKNYKKMDSLVEHKGDVFLRTQQYSGEKKVEDFIYAVKSSFTILCFNEGTINFLVELSYSESDSYTSSINLSPLQLKPLDLLPAGLKEYAKCHYKDNRFTVFQEDTGQLYAKISGGDFSTNKEQIFLAKLDDSESIPELEISLKLESRENNSSKSKGELVFRNKSELDIYNLKLSCPKLKMNLEELNDEESGALLSTTPIIGKEISRGSNLPAMGELIIPGLFQIEMQEKQIECSLNGIDISLTIER